jgi:chromosome segregation ATPase
MKLATTQFLLLLTLLGLVNTTHAANDRDRAVREAMRRSQMQVQQIEQEKAQLEEEKKKAIQETEAAKKQIGILKVSVASERRKRLSVEKDQKAVQDELAKAKEKAANLEKSLADMTAKETNTSRMLAQMEGEKKRAEQTIVMRDQTITGCETRNAKLYGYGRELMTQYERKSCKDALKQAEPFTGLKKVEIENLLEGYRDKLDNERISTSTGK